MHRGICKKTGGLCTLTTLILTDHKGQRIKGARELFDEAISTQEIAQATAVALIYHDKDARRWIKALLGEWEKSLAPTTTARYILGVIWGVFEAGIIAEEYKLDIPAINEAIVKMADYLIMDNGTTYVCDRFMASEDGKKVLISFSDALKTYGKAGDRSNQERSNYHTILNFLKKANDHFEEEHKAFRGESGKELSKIGELIITQLEYAILSKMAPLERTRALIPHFTKWGYHF